MSKIICDGCRKPIRADSAMVVINILDEPTRRYHGACFKDGRETESDGQDRGRR